jgi:hypothetical protein
MSMPLVPSRGRPLNVAIVAASLRILGGHSVQAQRMLDGWSGDPEVNAWLVPVDPVAPPPLDRLQRTKFVRTVATQVCYWPLLVRELRKADVVHVFRRRIRRFCSRRCRRSWSRGRWANRSW